MRGILSDISKIIPDFSEIATRSEIFIPDIIVSGGQDGVDRGGLLGAKDRGIDTGGYAPLGWRTESGSQPDLGYVFGLVESISAVYNTRTLDNMRIADAVLLICYNFDSPGSKLTERLAGELRKPLCRVTYPKVRQSPEDKFIVGDVKSWLHQIQPCVLMLAGNRESVAPGIQEWTRQFILKIFA